MVPGEHGPIATSIPEVPERGVAVPLVYRESRSGVRPYVLGDAENVWCEDTCEWWPFTASAVALYTLRAKFSDRGLCHPAVTGDRAKRRDA
jgi:hypothetical protein